MFDFIKNISPTEIALIILILIVLFGAKVGVRLARTGGEAVKEIKNIKREFTRVIIGDGNKPNKPSKS